tara:strand:+ start:375 stop:539 length:165 start_codon:yes stop_codon:yes gene_type:complete
MTDEKIKELFQDVGEMIKLQHKLLDTVHKRLNILEASQFKHKPLVLTKEMEVKN